MENKGYNNLKPFKKGDDPRRNITGLNKGSISIKRAVVKELVKCPDGQDKHTYLDLMVKKLIIQVIKKGDIAALRLIWNYVDGMPQQDHNIGGEFIVKWLSDNNKNNEGTNYTIQSKTEPDGDTSLSETF